MIITYLAHKTLASYFVAIISAIVLVVASPSRRDAFAVFTFKLRLGTFAILVLAH